MKKFFAVAILALLFSASSLKHSVEKLISFYSPEKGVYITDINIKKCPDCIEPYISDSLETVESVGKRTNSFIAVNAGFFDPSNRKTTSYIIKNGEIVADPTLNPNLADNPKLKKYLPQIFNRSEFRIMNCEDKDKSLFRSYKIALHNDKTPKECKIIHSLQGGPALFPELNFEQEAFVVKNGKKVIKESAGALGKFARTGIAIKKDHVLLVITSNEKKMTLKEFAEYMEKLKVDEAMAFDGGSSTSLYVKSPELVITSAKANAARLVKSMILVKKAD